MQRKGCIPTRYFFAGGRARLPCVKEEAYFSLEATRFFSTGVAIAKVVVSEQVLFDGPVKYSIDSLSI
jgi:hypothetical protein